MCSLFQQVFTESYRTMPGTMLRLGGSLSNPRGPFTFLLGHSTLSTPAACCVPKILNMLLPQGSRMLFLQYEHGPRPHFTLIYSQKLALVPPTKRHSQAPYCSPWHLPPLSTSYQFIFTVCQPPPLERKLTLLGGVLLPLLTAVPPHLEQCLALT